jgi:hypothetical protein
MDFWQILGNIGLVAGIVSSVATVVGYFTSPNASTRQKLKLVGVPFAILLIVAGLLSLLYSSIPHPDSSIPHPVVTPIATEGTTPAYSFSLARAYQGALTDKDALNFTSDMLLCSIAQNSNAINGAVKLSSLSGSGPFTGNIASDKHIRFTIINADDGYGPSDFSGSINTDGSMSGTYINHSLNQGGSWQVKPSSDNC